MTAKDLLYKVLEYEHLWAGDKRALTKPSKIRRRQIEALLSAFDLTKKNINPLKRIRYVLLGENKEVSRADFVQKLSTIEYITRGEFIRDRPDEVYTEIIETAKNTLNSIHKGLTAELQNKPVDIKWLFSSLFLFRQEIYKVTRPNEGMAEGFSIGLYYSFYLQHKLKEVILQTLDEIDDVLWSILDPDKRTIEKEELIKKYGYPDVDLKAVDLEWMVENY